jgi:hypothetical protein
MDYTYFLESHANKNISIDDIYNENIVNMIHFICYNVNTDSKYPFLEFMMEKVPFCNNFVKEQFIMPYILFSDVKKSIHELVLEKVKLSLKNMGCDNNNVNSNMYKGICYDNDGKPYAVVNITGIELSSIHLKRNSLIWMILASEIINKKNVCNINVDEDVTKLFIEIPELGILRNNKNNYPFLIPDAVYTGDESKIVEFNSLFGVRKMKEYDSCGEYFYFFKCFEDATKYGGWVKEGGINMIDLNNNFHTHNMSGRLIVENEYGKYIKGGVNRYALFVEGKLHMEEEEEFSLTDEIIKEEYNDECIIICYTGEHKIKSDILVKNYENFIPLSYHYLNKVLLDDQFIELKKNLYMIE